MKKINSPSKRWPGHVVLHDPLNLEQVFAIEDAQDAATELEPSKFLQKVNELGQVQVSTTWSSRVDGLLIPAILKCVNEWHLENFPDEPNLEYFPATPRKDARELIDWLWSEIDKLYTGVVDIP